MKKVSIYSFEPLQFQVHANEPSQTHVHMDETKNKTNKGIIKFEKNINYSESTKKNDEKLKDEFKKSINLENNISINMFHVKLTNEFLKKTKKIPIYYFDVVWSKSIKSILLYRFYIFFLITDEIKKKEELINNKLTGEYKLILSFEKNHQTIEELEEFDENQIIEKIKNFLETPLMKKKNKEIIEKKDQDIYGKYKEMFKSKKLKKPVDLDKYLDQ